MMMILKIEQNQDYLFPKQLFQEFSTLFVTLGAKKYRISAGFFNACKMIQQKIINNQYQFSIVNGKKIRIINLKNQRINPLLFEKILTIFQEKGACLIRNQDIFAISNLCQKLKIQSVKKMLEQDLQKNFQQYDVFLALSLSIKFKMPSIKRECFKLLKSEDFEQMNFNRYELFQSQPEVFKKVLKAHFEYRQKNSRRGLSNDSIFEIIQEYSKIKNVHIDAIQYMSKHLDTIFEQESEDVFESCEEECRNRKMSKKFHKISKLNSCSDFSDSENSTNSSDVDFEQF